MGNVTELFPMNWRFLPTVDVQVSQFMSRDLDSLIGKREVAAVKEWLQTRKTLHIMRDHPLHLAEIMGGLWGMNLQSIERYLMATAFIFASQDLVLYGLHELHNDQEFLFL